MACTFQNYNIRCHRAVATFYRKFDRLSNFNLNGRGQYDTRNVKIGRGLLRILFSAT